MTDFYRNKTVLVTGVAGFLGAHLARALLAAGADVIGLDRVTDSPCLRVHGLTGAVPILDADITAGPELLWHFIGGNLQPLPSVVFHLAGASHIAWCQEHPTEAMQANVVGTLNVLEACRALRDRGAPLDAVVVASSNHIYAGGTRGRGVPYIEADQIGAVDVYGMTKGAADMLARTWAESFGLPVVALRHLNAYGGADPHASHIVPATILSLLDGKAPVIRSDGNPVKGYLYIDDLIRAYLHAGQIAATRPGAYNIGGVSMALRVADLVQRIIGVSGRDAEPDIRGEDLSQKGYIEQLDDRVFRATGWRDETTLTEGLRATWNWYVAHGGMAWLSA